MISLPDNENAFTRIKLKPKAFASSKGFKGLNTKILGKDVNSPICVASTAFHKMAHPDGEIATARACESFNNTPYMLSSWSTVPLEEVAQESPNTLKIF
jgi:(S)-2-hydroxy-acid oxidase